MRYGDYFHVAVHDCDARAARSSSREIDIVTGPGWLLTVRHPDEHGAPVDLDEVARRFELQRAEHSSTEQGFLLWAIFDVLVDGYFDVTDMIDDRLDEIEETVFPIAERRLDRRRPRRRSSRCAATSRRSAAPRHRCARWSTRSSAGEIEFVGDEAIVHFHDMYDRVLRVGDLVEAQRDLLTGLLEAKLAVDLEPAQPGDEEDDVVGRDPHRRPR